MKYIMTAKSMQLKVSKSTVRQTVLLTYLDFGLELTKKYLLSI